MHVAFIHNNYENLGIEYLSACLKKAGHRSSLVFDPGLFSSFFLYNKALGRLLSFKRKVIEAVKKIKPDIVAFSVISDNYSWAVELARTIKEENNGIVIVFGGIHPTSVPEHVLRHYFIDFVVIGEGEGAIVELVNAIEKGGSPEEIPNIGMRIKGDIKINRVRPLIGLDDLPFPDKDLFFNEYAGMIDNSYMILGSRGCIYNCSYCWNSVINKVYASQRYFRRRCVNNIINELLWAKERYGIKRVTFYDEVFTSDKAWLREFLAMYRQKIGLHFFCCLHPLNCDEETVELLSVSGCTAVNVGVQTINPDTRRLVLNRPENNAQIIKSLELLGNKKMFIYSNIMLGIPNQGERELLENLNFCSRYKADLPAIYWLRYYPGTKIVDMAKEQSILSKEDIEAIECGAEYAPYAIGGNTYDKKKAKIGNLILLSGIIPAGLMEKIIKYKFYYLMPSTNLLFPVILVIGALKKFMQGKKSPFHYLAPGEYAAYYLFYIKKLFLGQICPRK